MNPKNDFATRHHLMVEIAQTIALTLLLFLTVHFTMQNFTIDGSSMEPNLHSRELVLVEKWTYLFHAPARGDVVIFKAPPDPSEDYVKRVIGLPGDVITVRGTTVIVNGVPLNETYIDPNNQGVPNGAHEITDEVIPANDYFVLGDNRAVSSDSRIWGFVPRSAIIGRAALVYWPLSQANDGPLPDVSAVFAGAYSPNQASESPLSALMTSTNALWLFLIPALLLLYWKRKALKYLFVPAARENMESDAEEATTEF